MKGGRRTREPAEGPAEAPFAEVVPARAVLTELARGFLLVHDSDPDRARRFAATFLKEQSGRGPVASPLLPPRLAQVRRGVATALRDLPGP